jgi:hypothetical protein
LNLEAADSQDLFRSGLNSTRYGLVQEAVNSNNPDGLPIGISKTVVATPIKGWPAAHSGHAGAQSRSRRRASGDALPARGSDLSSRPNSSVKTIVRFPTFRAVIFPLFRSLKNVVRPKELT